MTKASEPAVGAARNVREQRLPYQIIKEPYDQGWEHILVRELASGSISEVICATCSGSPIAPRWMRRKQAVLNSSYVLDQMGVY